MRKVVTYIAIFIFTLCQGQEGNYFLDIKQYPFIKYQANEITHPSGQNTFESLYQKMDSIMLFGEGKLNIVHIGGSHIQADIYTHQIRKKLQSLQYDMNGGRGLIFPFAMAKTNNPSNYKVRHTGEWSYCKNTQYKRSCPLGLTGISVTTQSKNATISVNPNIDSTIQYTIENVKIFHSPTSYSVLATIRDTIYSGIYDSVYGHTTIQVPSSQHIKLSFNLPDSIDESFTLYGISLENNNPGVVYHSIGVNGAKLESYLYCELYEQHLASIEPDLVIFSIGTNDGNTKHLNKNKFHDEYEELILRTLDAAPKARILITVPNDAYYYKRYVNENTPLLQKEIISIAKEHNYGVWDFFTIMGGLNSSLSWYNYDIMRFDRIHFNYKGYYLKGDLFLTALLRGWEKNLTARSTQYIHDQKLSNNKSGSQTYIE